MKQSLICKTETQQELRPDETDDTLFKFSPMVTDEEQALVLSPVVLGDNTAIGLNTLVLPGGVIGQNSWVGVQSVVTGEIRSGVIAAGNPAEVVKER